MFLKMKMSNRSKDVTQFSNAIDSILDAMKSGGLISQIDIPAIKPSIDILIQIGREAARDQGNNEITKENALDR